MKHSATRSAAFQSIITYLAEPLRIDALDPLGARFVYCLRLIAAHQRVKADPLPELVVRLRSVEVAAKALALSQAVSSCWPERALVSCFCHPFLTHDEATIGALIDAAANCDRTVFEGAIAGLIRPDRVHTLWDAVLAYVAAEAHAL